jgi:hypothetical protein
MELVTSSVARSSTTAIRSVWRGSMRDRNSWRAARGECCDHSRSKVTRSTTLSLSDAAARTSSTIRSTGRRFSTYPTAPLAMAASSY